MSLIFNGLEPDNVTFNGSNVESVTFNGTEIWSSGPKVENIADIQVVLKSNRYICDEDPVTGNLLLYVYNIGFPITKYTITKQGTIVNTEPINIPAGSGLPTSLYRIPVFFKHNNNHFAVFSNNSGTEQVAYILNIDDTTQYNTFNLPVNGKIAGVSMLINSQGELSDEVYLREDIPSQPSLYLLYKYNPTTNTLDLIRNGVTYYAASTCSMFDASGNHKDLKVVREDIGSSVYHVRAHIYNDPVSGTATEDIIDLTALNENLNDYGYVTATRQGDVFKIIYRNPPYTSRPISGLISVDMTNKTATVKDIKNTDQIKDANSPTLAEFITYINGFGFVAVDTTVSKLIKYSGI